MTESTAPSTEEPEEVDGATIDDNRIDKRLKKPVGKRSFNSDLYVPKRKRYDDGQHWKPSPPPYRRGDG